MNLPEKATKPTMYFIGVTTGESSIMRVFPAWADAMDLGDVEIKGIDLEIRAPAEGYRSVLRLLKKIPYPWAHWLRHIKLICTMHVLICSTTLTLTLQILESYHQFQKTAIK